MSAERRRAPRQDMRWEALIIDQDGSIVDRCMMVNVSATGAKLLLAAPKDVPESFVLVLSKKGEVRRQCEITWRSTKSVGVRFIATQVVEDDEISFVSDALSRMSSRD